MAPGIRQADHKEARAACAAASSSASWRCSVPESSCLGAPAWSLFSRELLPSREHPPPPGQVPYWVRSRLAKRCLQELFSRDFRERLPVVAWKIWPQEPERALWRERVSCGVGPGSGCRGIAAGAASSRRASSRTLPRLVGAAAADRGRAPGVAASGAARAAGAAGSGQPRGGRASGGRRGERAAAGRGPPLGHLLAPRPPLEDVSGEAHVLPAGVEQDHLGGARAIPEPVPGGLGRLWLSLVSVAGPRVEGRIGASRVALHA